MARRKFTRLNAGNCWARNQSSRQPVCSAGTNTSIGSDDNSGCDMPGYGWADSPEGVGADGVLEAGSFDSPSAPGAGSPGDAESEPAAGSTSSSFAAGGAPSA